MRVRTSNDLGRGLDVDVLDVELGQERLVVLSSPVHAPTFPDALTPAEREIAQLVLAGRSDHQIACVRRTSIKTVANQLATVFAKAGVSSRAAFVAQALVGPEDEARDA